MVLGNIFLEEDITYISNGNILDPYLEISKFQKYAKQFYNKELDINYLKEYLKVKDNSTYILANIEGLEIDSAIKADYIIENKQDNSKSLYIDIIDLYSDNFTSEETNNYLLDDFLEYDKTRVSSTLRITYAINYETQKNYILSIETIN